MSAHLLRRHAFITLGLLFALLAWDASPLDMRLAQWFGGPQGFPLTEHWLLTNVLHDGGRLVSWGVAVALTLAVWWPVGPLRRLESRERVQLIATTLLSVLLVSLLKSFSPTSCPWDLSAFGGVARHLSHWSWQHDGGSGRCFPGGHASSGFAFIGGYFVWRGRAPKLARLWLAVALLAGFTLGMAQQARGAHFMSHTFWTAWLCWTFALSVAAVVRPRLNPSPVAPHQGPPTLPPPQTVLRPGLAGLARRLAGWRRGGSGSSSISP